MPSLPVNNTHSREDTEGTLQAIGGELAIWARALEDGVERYLVGQPVPAVYRRCKPAERAAEDI
jgi:glutamate-1-semialdehyde 2,1-aminomutase